MNSVANNAAKTVDACCVFVSQHAPLSLVTITIQSFKGSCIKKAGSPNMRPRLRQTSPQGSMIRRCYTRRFMVRRTHHHPRFWAAV